MNEEPTRLTVSPGAEGVRLDQFLAQPLGSRSRAQSLIDTGRVLVGGKRRPKRYIVRMGDFVEVEAESPRWTSRPGWWFTPPGDIPAARWPKL
jgi:ribosomal 50S subunit-recycling heat shock protein